jgi:hypothetical protein
MVALAKKNLQKLKHITHKMNGEIWHTRVMNIILLERLHNVWDRHNHHIHGKEAKKANPDLLASKTASTISIAANVKLMPTTPPSSF